MFWIVWNFGVVVVVDGGGGFGSGVVDRDEMGL